MEVDKVTWWSSMWVTWLKRPKSVKDDVKQARRAKRVAEGHQLEIGAQRAPRFLVLYNLATPDKKIIPTL